MPRSNLFLLKLSYQIWCSKLADRFVTDGRQAEHDFERRRRRRRRVDDGNDDDVNVDVDVVIDNAVLILTAASNLSEPEDDDSN